MSAGKKGEKQIISDFNQVICQAAIARCKRMHLGRWQSLSQSPLVTLGLWNRGLLLLGVKQAVGECRNVSSRICVSGSFSRLEQVENTTAWWHREILECFLGLNHCKSVYYMLIIFNQILERQAKYCPDVKYLLHQAFQAVEVCIYVNSNNN